MMLKSQNPAHPLLRPLAAQQLNFACALVFSCISMLLLATGCRQAGAPANSAGMAPISAMPGQAPMTGPTLPALGPFGASARVPPPATGSYGSPSIQSAGTSAVPANYAPANIAPMSYAESSGGNSVAVAGGFGNQQNAPNGAPGGSSWQEMSTYPGPPTNPQMDLSQNNSRGVRSGGMPVNDLTGAPPPPGYSAPFEYGNPMAASNTQSYAPQTGQYPATSLMPMPNIRSDTWGPLPASPSVPVNPTAPPASMPSTSAPISGGGFVDASPAANQPSMSTANRPVQWQSPRR